MLFTLIPGLCGEPVHGPKESEALQPPPRAHTPSLTQPQQNAIRRPPSPRVSEATGLWEKGPECWVNDMTNMTHTYTTFAWAGF